MGVIFKQYLDDATRVYCCAACHLEVADADAIVSKAFQGRHGRAYLFDTVVNVSDGAREERQLITGLHAVSDVSCVACASVLGWRYIQAFEESQRYKEGRVILEKAKITLVGAHADGGGR